MFWPFKNTMWKCHQKYVVLLSDGKPQVGLTVHRELFMKDIKRKNAKG